MKIVDKIMDISISLLLVLALVLSASLAFFIAKDFFGEDDTNYRWLNSDSSATLLDIRFVVDEVEVIKDYILKEKCEEMGGKHSYQSEGVFEFDGLGYVSTFEPYKCTVGSKVYHKEDLNWVYTMTEVK